MFELLNSDVKKHQGNIGLMRAIYEYTRLGFTVSVPLTDSSKYDLLIEYRGDVSKVQVKTSGYKKEKGGFEVTLATRGGNTKQHTITRVNQEDYDLLFVLTDDNQCWSIPMAALEGAGTAIIVGNKKYNEYRISELRPDFQVTVDEFRYSTSGNSFYGFVYDGRIWAFDTQNVLYPYYKGDILHIKNIKIEKNTQAIDPSKDYALLLLWFDVEGKSNRHYVICTPDFVVK